MLHQYFPKRSDLKPYNQADVDAVAAELNGRPRKTLEFHDTLQRSSPRLLRRPVGHRRYRLSYDWDS